MARLVRTLREDEDFLARYYATVDRLRAEHDICARGEDGFFGSVDPDIDPASLWMGAADIVEALTDEMGAEAVAVLERAGWQCHLNGIGMVTVSLEGAPE